MAPHPREIASEPHGWLLEALAAPGATAAAAAPPPSPALAARLGALAARVGALEDRRTSSARRAARDAKGASAFVGCRWVPATYYGSPMRARADILGCDVRQMCKSMLVENKQWKGTDPFARGNARHYLVVVQYAATFDANALRSALAKAADLPGKAFNFRVATAEDCATLAGFGHNAVTPFGMAEPRVPIVLAAAAAAAPAEFLWMGGGHEDFKLGVPVADFLKRFAPLVLDVSAARDEASWDDAPAAANAAAPPPPPPAKSKKEKKAAPPKKAKAAEHAEMPGGDDDTACSRLALVVGKIVEVWPHPDSDKLFCEKIDCGEKFGGIRSIASGLQPFYAKEDLLDRVVLVAANLKAKKLGGFPSQGMVLCASNAAHDAVKFVDPPASAAIGDFVTFDGLDNPHASDSQVDKKKLFLKAMPHFTTRGGVCYYKDKAFAINGAPCTAPAEDGWAIS